MARTTRRIAPPGSVAFTLLVFLAGCAQEQAYLAPTFAFKNAFASRQSGTPVLLENVAWWRGFKDPTLDALIDRALQGNIDMAIARERVAEASANVQTVPAEGSVTTSASVNRTKVQGSAAQTESTATVGLSWLLDPFGQRREEIKAARARVEVADAEVDAARLLVLYNLCNAYIDLRYRQRALQIRQSEIASRRQTLALTRTLFDQQSATRLDVVRTEARLAEAEAAVPAARAAIVTEKYRIATLLGEAPGTLNIDLDRNSKQPRSTMSTSIGIPADLMRNRPDIRIAERLYYATLSDVAVARADLYPKLSLGGAISLASISGKGASEYYFGPSIVLPALPTGSRMAVVNARESRARQANASWKSTVLDALFEVETGLLDYSASAEAVTKSRKSQRLYNEAVTLTRDLVRSGNATIPDLLDAEESTVDADLTVAENMRQNARNFVRLNISLGAGNAEMTAPATQ